MSGTTDAKAQLHREVGAFGLDPLGYVRFAFPWGMPGTPLAADSGPEAWQCEVLQQLGQGLAAPDEAVRVAVASGHGVGKSALVSWIILWALSTLHDTRGVVSANTEAQLRTKTWPELAKWHGLCHQPRLVRLHRDGARTRSLPGHDRTWRVDASPGRRTTPRPSPACTTRAAAPSPCSTRRRPSPTRCGRPSRAR